MLKSAILVALGYDVLVIIYPSYPLCIVDSLEHQFSLKTKMTCFICP